MKVSMNFKTLLISIGCLTMLNACVSPEAYVAQYKEATGIDPTKLDPVIMGCEMEPGSKTRYEEWNIACAKKSADKVIVNDDSLFYSEYKNGVKTQCKFLGFDRNIIVDRLGKGVGIVEPILMYGDAGNISVDWKATEALIATLRRDLKIKVESIEASKLYFNYLLQPRALKPTAGIAHFANLLKPEDVDLKYYSEVVSKFPKIDYVIGTSSSVRNDVLNGTAIQEQEYYKDISSMLDPNKKTFKPNEIQKFQAQTSLLVSRAYKNRVDISLTIDLVERLKNINPTANNSMFVFAQKSGCEIEYLQTKLDKVIEAEKVSAKQPSFAERLATEMKDMVNIDLSKGFELSLDNSENLRKNFLAQRQAYLDAKKDYLASIAERSIGTNSILIPFTAKSFTKFKVSGFVKSKKLD
jgi:hypothetical protein